MADFGFPKELRLLNAGDFEAVFSKNQYKVANRHFLILAMPSQQHSSRLGMVVAKKHIAKAVERNRVKRLIRETFRHTPAMQAALDQIVLVRKGADKLTNQELSNTLKSLWSDLQAKQRRHLTDSQDRKLRP